MTGSLLLHQHPIDLVLFGLVGPDRFFAQFRCSDPSAPGFQQQHTTPWARDLLFFNRHRVGAHEYVYVISNRGAFGEHVFKIGLTRRLEPLERIYELGDASVPFRFDVHALYFSEDAVTLANELHQHFSDRRVNWVNMRREFFFATPAEVRAVLAEKLGNLLEFTEHAESTEYLQSVHYWPDVVQRPGPNRV